MHHSVRRYLCFHHCYTAAKNNLKTHILSSSIEMLIVVLVKYLDLVLVFEAVNISRI